MTDTKPGVNQFVVESRVHEKVIVVPVPHIKEWQDKYSDKGLSIVGVHTPEFDFEKRKENVAEAVRANGLTYPVVQDNERHTWDVFRNQVWPAKYLIGGDGIVKHIELGEGGYIAVEQAIRYYLKEAGYSVADIPLVYRFDAEIDLKAKQAVGKENRRTRELYAGTAKNLPFHRFPPPQPWVLYDQFYEQLDADQRYDDPGEHKNHHIYIQGLWHNGRDSLTHARETQDHEDYMAIKFNSKTVNVVLGREGSVPYEVRVTIDGRPLAQAQADSDIRFDRDGNSYALVDEPRMYRLVRLPEFETHELKLSSNSDGFSLYTFTFGAYEKDIDN